MSPARLATYFPSAAPIWSRRTSRSIALVTSTSRSRTSFAHQIEFMSRTMSRAKCGSSSTTTFAFELAALMFLPLALGDKSLPRILTWLDSHTPCSGCLVGRLSTTYPPLQNASPGWLSPLFAPRKSDSGDQWWSTARRRSCHSSGDPPLDQSNDFLPQDGEDDVRDRHADAKSVGTARLFDHGDIRQIRAKPDRLFERHTADLVQDVLHLSLRDGRHLGGK